MGSVARLRDRGQQAACFLWSWKSGLLQLSRSAAISDSLSLAHHKPRRESWRRSLGAKQWQTEDEEKV